MERHDAPMLLSTFEHITRGALLNWWNQLPVEDISLPGSPFPTDGQSDGQGGGQTHKDADAGGRCHRSDQA